MSDQQCREALRSLPPDLPETYLRILKRVPEAQQLYVQLTLDFIAFADPKLRILQLREILSLPSNSSSLQVSGLVREDAITRHCGSLIRKSNDGEYFEFAHFSVQEFLRSRALQSSEFQMFSISESRCNRLLATRCLEYLQLHNFSYKPTPTEEGLSKINQNNEKYPLYGYAARNWMCYAREQWDDPSLLASAKRLFDPCKSACFTHWAVVLVLQLREWAESLKPQEKLDLIAEIVDEGTHPLHFAATLSLPEISAFLLPQMNWSETS